MVIFIGLIEVQSMPPVSIFIIAALVFLGLASAVIGQKTLDKWTRDTGRRPMIPKGRGSWSRYLRSVEAELPPSVRQRIALCKRIATISMILVPVVFFLDAVWLRH
jgi:hypothetical protein